MKNESKDDSYNIVYSPLIKIESNNYWNNNKEIEKFTFENKTKDSVVFLD